MYKMDRMRGISDIPVKKSAPVDDKICNIQNQPPCFRDGEHALNFFQEVWTLLGMSLTAGKLCNPYNSSLATTCQELSK